MGIGQDDLMGHTGGPSQMPKFCNFGGLLSGIGHLKGRLGDHESP